MEDLSCTVLRPGMELGTLAAPRVRWRAEIDVVATPGNSRNAPGKQVRGFGWWAPRRLLRYVESVGVVALCTLLCAPFRSLVEPTNIIMVYLLGVVALATRLGRGPAVLASFLSVMAFDYFYVPPHLSFDVADTQYLFTFLVMLVVSLVISTLTVRLRGAVQESQLRERRTASLYALSRDLAMLRGQQVIAQTTARHIAELFNSEVVVVLPDAAGRPTVIASQPPGLTLDAEEQSVTQWVHDQGQMAGKGTGTIPSAQRLYVPLLASHGALGALGLKPADLLSLMIPEPLQLLGALAQQAALSLEVDRLTEEAQRQQVQIGTERFRNALLSSVSHDLRTPLAAITGAASSLLDSTNPLPEPNRQEMLLTIYEEAEKLGQQVGNLLEMTRLEAGTLSVRKELQPLEETIGSACQRLENLLRDRQVRIAIPPDLPLVPADAVLLEKVFFNLLENAAKYTPAGSPLEIEARQQGSNVLVEVRDHGSGLGEHEQERVFEKFFRGATHGRTSGAGLGLSICRGVIHAHGGRIWADNRPGGGAVFRFTLPLEASGTAEPPKDPGFDPDSAETGR